MCAWKFILSLSKYYSLVEAVRNRVRSARYGGKQTVYCLEGSTSFWGTYQAKPKVVASSHLLYLVSLKSGSISFVDATG